MSETPEVSDYLHFLEWLQQKYPAIYLKYSNNIVTPEKGRVINLSKTMKGTEDFGTLVKVEYEYYHRDASPEISRTSINAVLLLLRIGQNIARVRRSRPMTQATLASLCKMEKASMSRIESGKTNITMVTLLTIANSLEVTVLDLVTIPPSGNAN